MKQITIIEKTINQEPIQIRKKRKAAAYARVSTEKDEQFSSYEAQIDYYTNLIKDNDNYEFVKVYTDEGITGTSTKHRKGFNEMINDAINGKIDIIITKSISRFARNTVDSLVTIRKLKEIGCEIYFEKENIYTFDSKGELLITIMSSLAQEESRSISENVTWGIRKKFSDGIYHMHYSEFLGYDRGSNGEPIINEKEAIIVRRIYLMFLEGITPYNISKILTKENIPTATHNHKWYVSVVQSILSNEKYTGDAILQKTINIDFLTKKRKPNNGEVNQYYIKNGHPGIITHKMFNEVQKKLKNNPRSRFYENDNELSKRIKCGCCGNWFYLKKVNKGQRSEKHYWACNKKNATYTCKSIKYTIEKINEIINNCKSIIINNKNILINSLRKLNVSNEIIYYTIQEIQEINKYLKYEKNDILIERINLLNDNLKYYNYINQLIKSDIDYNELVDILINNNLLIKLIDYIIVDRNDISIVTINNDILKV